MSDIIEISDSSDFEPTFIIARRELSDSEEEVVVLEEPRPSSPASIPPSSFPPSSQEQVYDLSDLEIDIDIPDASEVINNLSEYEINHLPSPSNSLKKKKTLEESDDDSSRHKPTERHRKTAEEKVLEQAAKKLEKERKKQETQRKREEAAARKAEEKAAHKASKAVNKLVIDKKATLKDIIIELSPRLIHSPLYLPLEQKMSEFDCNIQPISFSGDTVELVDFNALKNLNLNIIRWKRRVKATYNESQQQWIPLPEEQHYLRPEGTYLIYVTGDELVNSLSQRPTVPPLDIQVSMLRRVLGPRYHIHLMLCGWKGKTNLVKILDLVQTQLVTLQVKESLYVEEVDDINDAVTWIYNISADLGIKPHKLIERSHLPFCPHSSGSFKVGRTNIDTFEKMLAQLPRLSETSARAVAKKFGSINKLMEEYKKAEPSGRGPMMLANIPVPGSQDRERILNKALSERLYHVLWGIDPKLLVN